MFTLILGFFASETKKIKFFYLWRIFFLFFLWSFQKYRSLGTYNFLNIHKILFIYKMDSLFDLASIKSQGFFSLSSRTLIAICSWMCAIINLQILQLLVNFRQINFMNFKGNFLCYEIIFKMSFKMLVSKNYFSFFAC